MGRAEENTYIDLTYTSWGIFVKLHLKILTINFLLIQRFLESAMYVIKKIMTGAKKSADWISDRPA